MHDESNTKAPFFEILKLNFIVLIMLLVWASAYIGIRAGLESYSPGCLALLRYSVASLCMLVMYFRLPDVRLLQWKEILAAALAGILGFSIYNYTLNSSELTLDAGVASFIISQAPVITTFLGMIFLSERLSLKGWIGTLISIFGLLLIALGETKGGSIRAGVFYALIATLVSSVYALLQKPLLRTLHPVEFTAVAIWSGTLALIFYLPSLVHEIVRAPLSSTLWVVYIGIFPAALGYVLWAYVSAKMPVAKAASYLYLLPLFTIILGWLILAEIPKLLAILGGLVALGGSMLVQRGVRIKMKLPLVEKSQQAT